MLKGWGSVVFAAAMVVSATASVAGDKSNTDDLGPLAPGKAASVEQAQMSTSNKPLVVFLGLGIVIGGVALIVSNNGNGTSSTPTTRAP